MEKRVIAAIALSIAILFAFRYFEDRRLAQMPRPRPTAATQTAPAGTPPPQVAAEAEGCAQTDRSAAG